MKTKAAVLFKIDSPLEILELEIPLLKPGQVLVNVVYSGLCHSQLNEVKGLKGEDKFLPHTLGHEGSGIVVEIGAGVTKVKPGNRVVLSWIKGKGADIPGCTYKWKETVINSGAICTFLTYSVISENRLIPIPDEMPLREAALLGCALPTGAGVIKREMSVKEGHSIAIFGLGGVGLSALLAAKIAGANPLIAIDVHSEKLMRAKNLGASHVINALKNSVLHTIHEITQGKGVDFAFEAAGKKEVMEQAFSSIKAPGGLCVLAGNLPKGQTLSIDPFDLIRGKRIVGTWGGGSQIDEDIFSYVKSYLSNSFNFAPLISHEVELEKINELLKGLEEGKVIRGLINMS